MPDSVRKSSKLRYHSESMQLRSATECFAVAQITLAAYDISA